MKINAIRADSALCRPDATSGGRSGYEIKKMSNTPFFRIELTDRKNAILCLKVHLWVLRTEDVSNMIVCPFNRVSKS